MSDVTGTRATIIRTNLTYTEPYTFLSDKAIYPNNTKRIIVKGTSNRNLENQVVKIQSNTFSSIIRNFDELYPNVDFEEI